MDARLRTQVRDRAGRRCEYCRIHEDDDPFFTFPIDHVIAQQHGARKPGPIPGGFHTRGAIIENSPTITTSAASSGSISIGANSGFTGSS